jgi:uncharacterized protein
VKKKFLMSIPSMTRALTTFLAVLLGAASLLMPHRVASAADARVPSTIEVTADAEIEAPADLAIVELGVVAQAQTAAAAAQRNAEQMQAVLAALRKALPGDTRIETGAYSVNPDYTRPQSGATAQVVGYTARNTVRVIVTDLARVGTVIDTAVNAGGNQVQRVTFTLRDPAAAQNEALRKAVQVAREKAQTVASALGLQVTGFYNAVAQEVGAVRPVFQDAAAFARAESAAPTPVEPGRILVRSRVTLTVRVGS